MRLYSHEERLDRLSVHLVNPSDNSFGTAVITPRWLFVLAAATPREAGDPILVDESLEQIVPETIQAGDIVGISVHTGNALRGYQVGRMAREPGRVGGVRRHSRDAVSRGGAGTRRSARGGEGRRRHCLGQGGEGLPGGQAGAGVRRRTD